MDNPSRDGAEVELGVFLQAMWRRRSGIIAGTVGAMLIGLVAFLVLPRQYEAKARLAIGEFHLRESPTGDDGRETFAALVSSRETYATLVQSPTIARRIVEEQGLDESLDITAEELLDKINIELIPNTAMLELIVELPDPDIAFDVADAFATQAAALSKEINNAARQRAGDVLAAQLEAADAELDRLEIEIGAFQESTSVPSPRLLRLESEFENSLTIRADIASRLESSEIVVASQIAELIIVDRPVVPGEPSSPGLLLILATAGFLGLILSLMVAGMVAGIEATGA